jgi:hypothetical protein
MAVTDQRVSELERSVKELGEAMVEHRVRLENGVNVFASHREKIATLEEKVAPKPLSVLKVVSLSFGIFVVLSGALWYLSENLANRPTTDQLRNVMESHRNTGHPATQKEIGEMREDLVEQRTLIKDVRSEQTAIKNAQADHGKKLDELLQRAPRRRPHR